MTYEGLYRHSDGTIAVKLFDYMEQHPVSPPVTQPFPSFRLTKEELLPDVGLVATNL